MTIHFDPALWLRDFRALHGNATLTEAGYLSTVRHFAGMTREELQQSLKLQQELKEDPRKLQALWDFLRSADATEKLVEETPVLGTEETAAR